MKTSRIYRYVWLIILIAGWTTAQGQYQQEVPGDNFSLEGALELFKQSESPEAFEKKLNHPDSKVNNLDLNGDGYIDYIRVIDMNERNVHAFVLQSVISHNEFQDIAVITLEKRSNGNAVLQITGDADIYGVETIIEPTTEVRTYAGTTSSRAVVNVWSWPMVRYVYSPYYSVWVSPWGWGYRPRWWSPWRPVYYYDYYTHWRPYRRYYSVCYTHRVVYAHKIYRPHRSTSVIVHNNHHQSITKYRTRHIGNDGSYRQSSRGSYYRPTSTTVRYDAKGRIRTGGDKSDKIKAQRSSKGHERSTNRYQRPTKSNSGYVSSGRSTNDGRVRSSRSQQSSSGNNGNGSYRGNSTANDKKHVKGTRSTTSGRWNSNGNSSSRSSSTYGRSSSSSQQKSYTPKVQRSTQRSSSKSSYGRSSGSANTNRYSGRSSGSTNTQRYSGRSSGSSNTKSYSGRSSGSSNVRRSTSSPSVRQSSGSSQVKRSSSGSSSPRSSSGRSSSSSRSGRSGSSRGRN